MKKLALSLFALSALWANGSAFAAPVSCETVPNTIDDFKALGDYDSTNDINGCLQDDKVWSGFRFSGYGLPVGSTPSLSLIPSPSLDLHSFTISFPAGFINPTGNDITSTISYNIEIYPYSSTYNDHSISLAKLQYVIENGTIDVSKSLVTDVGGNYLLTGNNETQNLIGQIKYVQVIDTLTLKSGATLKGVTNDFSQTAFTTVPEPGSLSLMGIGLAASLAFSKRRKAKR
jgi:hypothetical protein